MADIKKYFDPENKSNKKILIKGPQKFVTTVEKNLNDWVYYSYTGRQVLKEIWGSRDGLGVTITYSQNTWNTTVNNDPATEEDETTGQFAKGVTFKDVDELKSGTGKGGSPVIYFDADSTIPASFCKAGVCPSPRFALVRFALFHELVHAMRQIKGLWTTTPITMNNKPTSLEEGIAILLTNMLMSEKGDNTVRADHQSMDTVIADPYATLRDAAGKKIVEKIKADHSGMFTYLAALKFGYFPYNPFHVAMG